MQNRPEERFARRPETKGGGEITIVTSIIADMNFILVITQTGNHHGKDRKSISSLEMEDNLTW